MSTVLWHGSKEVTRWLVYNGVIDLEVFRDATVTFEVVTWLIAVACSIIAIGLVNRKSSKLRLAGCILAGPGTIVGYLGALAISQYWPRVVYCQTNGEAVFAFDLSWLFAVPVALGMTAFVAATSGKVICPVCHLPGIRLGEIWLGSVRRPHKCLECAALCRLRQPTGFDLLSAIWAVGVLGLGYGAAGRVGLLLIMPACFVSTAWGQQLAIRKFKLLGAAPKGDQEKFAPT